jgi:hypothetical protein
MRTILAATCIALLLLPAAMVSWGEKGHLLVNRLAIEFAARDLPPFMETGKSRLIYNAFEPDRWREEAGSPMNTAQAPDHFFDSEMWGTDLDAGAGSIRLHGETGGTEDRPFKSGLSALMQSLKPTVD